VRNGTQPAGEGSARVADAVQDRARWMVPTPSCNLGAGEESAVEHNSRTGFSAWMGQIGELGVAACDSAVSRFWRLVVWLGLLLEREAGARPQGSGTWWFGLAVVFAAALLLEAVLIPVVWPWLLHGGDGRYVPTTSISILAPLLMGLPVRREIEIDVPAPAEAPGWPTWPPATEPEPVEQPEPIEVPA
jgi:hypothetical protein